MTSPSVTVDLDGTVFTVPELDWWPILESGNLTRAFPDGLPPAERSRIAGRLFDPNDGLDLVNLVEIAFDVAEAVTEQPWYAAIGLARFAAEHRTDIRGWYACSAGRDLFAEPVAVGLCVAWRFACVSNLDEAQRVIAGAPSKSRDIRKATKALAAMRASLWTDPTKRSGEARFNPDAEAALAAQLAASMNL